MIIKFLKFLSLILSILIALSAGNNIYYYFYPEVSFANTSVDFDKYNYLSISDNTNNKQSELPRDPIQIPKDNRIIIPKIKVDAPITEGDNASALNIGMWRRPMTSTPDKGGNTVITGHRVLYTSGPDTFYLLDKLIVNDAIVVYWQGKEYIYRVSETKVVYPQQTDIEDNTKEPIITLYTCTPARTSLRRLVVIAKLQQ